MSFVLFVTAGDVMISLSIGTPQNGSYAQGDSIFVNASANTTSGNVSLFLDFNNSLVSWWRMDDANSTHVFDYTGRNNGTIVNDTRQIEDGYFGKGMIFDGDLDRIAIANPEVNFSQGTLSGWFYMNNTPGTNGEGGIIQTGQGDGQSEYLGLLCDYDGNFCRLDIDDGDDSCGRKYLLSSGIDITEIWTFISMTFISQDSAHLYLNGVEYGSGVSLIGCEPEINPSITWVIGTQSVGVGEFNGTLDDIMVFNRSLTASEIQALYANQSTKYLERNITSLTEETNYYTLYAQDTSGNVSTLAQQITLDNTAPVIEINSPLNQAYTSSPISFNVSATDTNSLSDCWYLIDSDGINVSMTNVSTIYTDSYSPSSNGDYSVVFYCNDSAGNLNVTEAVNFSLAIPAVETEENEEIAYSGSGAPTLYPSQEKLLQGYEVSLGSKFKVNLSIGSDKHQLVVNSIQNGTVNITISSDPVTFTLQANQTKQLDLNSDSIYDLSVYLKLIKGNRANLVVTSTSEPYSLPEEVAVDTPTQTDDFKIDSKDSTLDLKLLGYLLIGILAISATILLGSYFLRRKKKS